MAGSEAPSAVPARRVLVVDDHPIVREGVTQMISAEHDLEVCGQAKDVDEALRLVRELEPDVVVVDLSLPGTSGFELIRQLVAENERMLVLVLSMHAESAYVHRAIKAGAHGYVTKDEATTEVVTAIRALLRGESYFSRGMAVRLVKNLVDGRPVGAETPISKLSQRELEVFELVGEGQGTRQIAERLGVSVKTIEAHKEHIKRKLSLGNANELARAAFQWSQAARLDPT